MKVTIKRACGCLENVNITGPVKGRDKKIAALEHYNCTLCSVKEKLKENDEGPLPPLEGSDKQIAWAFGVRQKVYESMMSARTRLYLLGMSSCKDSADGDSTQLRTKLATRLDAIVDHITSELFSETSSHWWINNEDTLPIDWDREFCRVQGCIDSESKHEKE